MFSFIGVKVKVAATALSLTCHATEKKWDPFEGGEITLSLRNVASEYPAHEYKFEHVFEWKGKELLKR